MAVAAAEKAVRCLGLGFDMTCDLRLKFCKDSGGCVVARSSGETTPVSVPGVGVVRDMPDDVKCGKGDRVRFKSDALEFNKMSEVFNQRSSVEGKIPSGQFNACFDLDSGSWAQDASSTKCLAMDGYFISLFDLRLDRRQLALAGHVLRDVPAAWDPAAIASFIDKYGTHVVVGLSMGGQDVVYVRQHASSPLSPSEIRGHLDRLGDQLFTGACAVPPPHCKSKSKFKMPEAFNVFDAQVAQQRLQGITTLVSSKEGVTVIYSKRGGNPTVSSHSEWLLTVPAAPDVINVKLVPITSLLRGVAGTGFLSHAINLYLRSSQNVGSRARRAAPRPMLQSPRLQPGPAFQPAGLQALCQLKSGDCADVAGHGDEAAPRGQEEQPARRPRAAPVGHPDVHRRRRSHRQAAGVARLRDGLQRRPPLLRAGHAVADVRARLHRAGQVRPPLAPLRVRPPPQPLRRGLHRHRRAAPRQGARRHQRAAPQAALLRGPRPRRRAVQVDARRRQAVGQGVQLPVHALLRVLLLVGKRRRRQGGAAAAPEPAACGPQRQLRCLCRRAAGARGRAEAAQVRGHLAGHHGPARQPRVLARHRRQARRRQGQDLAPRKVLPASPGLLTVPESVYSSFCCC